MSELRNGLMVYDVLNALRRYWRLSIRKMAVAANISPTTLTSILDRRPKKISIRTLDAIARVFDTGWMDLYDCEANALPSVDATGKVSAFLLEGDFDRIMNRLVCTTVAPQVEVRSLNTRRPVTHPNDRSDDFKRSIQFVLERLNNDGLVEAMRRILELEKEERYCIKASDAGNKTSE